MGKKRIYKIGRGNEVAKQLQTLTDEQIVELMQSGELDVYEELVKRYQDKLVNYAMTIVKDDQIAIDVVQDGLIKAYTKIQSFDTKKKFSSWIFRIIHNQAIDYIRKHRKEVAVGEQEWLLDSVPTNENREKELELKMKHIRIHQCVQALPVDYRSVISLYYLEEKSYKEISDILRIPEGTVATRLSRGKKALAVLCKDQEDLDV